MTDSLKYVEKLAASDQNFLVLQDRTLSSNDQLFSCNNAQRSNYTGRYCIHKKTGAYLGHFANEKEEVMIIGDTGFRQLRDQGPLQNMSSSEVAFFKQRPTMKAVSRAADRLHHEDAQFVNTALMSVVESNTQMPIAEVKAGQSSHGQHDSESFFHVFYPDKKSNVIVGQSELKVRIDDKEQTMKQYFNDALKDPSHPLSKVQVYLYAPSHGFSANTKKTRVGEFYYFTNLTCL